MQLPLRAESRYQSWFPAETEMCGKVLEIEDFDSCMSRQRKGSSDRK
jgi:hypothetical protein